MKSTNQKPLAAHTFGRHCHQPILSCRVWVECGAANSCELLQRSRAHSSGPEIGSGKWLFSVCACVCVATVGVISVRELSYSLVYTQTDGKVSLVPSVYARARLERDRNLVGDWTPRARLCACVCARSGLWLVRFVATANERGATKSPLARSTITIWCPSRETFSRQIDDLGRALRVLGMPHCWSWPNECARSLARSRQACGSIWLGRPQ